MIPESTLAALELQAVLDDAAERARTTPGQLLLRAARPLTSRPALEAACRQVEEAVRLLESDGERVPSGLPDPAPILPVLRREGAVLEALQALGLARWLWAADEAAGALAAAGAEGEPRGELLARLMAPARGLSVPFRGLLKVITAAGEIEDAASPALASARRKVAATRADLSEKLEALLSDPRASRPLQDRYVTLRGERHVVPVRAEARAEFPGILHGASSTGQTLFMEPLATVELNNDLVAARAAEQEEVRRFLTEVTTRLRAQRDRIEAAIGALAALDATLARARWGRERQAHLAETADEVCLRLEGARHPLLETALGTRGGALVPLALSLGPEPRVLVISGPNAGGKSLALKSVGLLCLMHQCALPVPALRARLPVFASMAIDIGDQQSIAESLSTFSARMRNLAAMAGIEERPMLILLDELGSGTDPMEGGALGIALLEHFRSLGAMVVATTHHDQIRAHALSTPELASAAMEFDAERLAPTYRLKAGVPGASAGIEIAQRMGLPGRIVEEARRLLGDGARRAAALLERLRDKVEEAEEKVLALARRERELEDLDAGRARRSAERERLRRADFEAQVEKALDAIRQEGRQVLERLAEQERAAAGKSFSKGLKRAAEAARAMAPGSSTTRSPEGASASGAGEARLVPGTRVRIASLGHEGVVEEVDESGGASVLVRGVRVRARLSDLAPVAGTGHSPPRVRWDVSSRARVAERIELIGARVEEALEKLHKYLDDAALAGHREVRVIHGSGSGRLRAAVGKFLSSHPHVESHRLEEERPGGRGVTLVQMRS